MAFQMKHVTTNTATITRRQRPFHRACEACRRRKRRCNHVLGSGISMGNISDMSNISVSPPSSPEQRQFGHGQRTPPTPEAFGSYSRPPRQFIEDLNPESILQRAAANRSAAAPRGFYSQDSVGTWLVENLKASGKPRKTDVQSHIIKPEGIFFNISSTTQRLLSSLLEEECFSEIPSETYLAQLLTFYAEEIYPVFPLIDIRSFQTSIDRNSKILLSQAMCLIASTNPQCKDLLYLRGKGGLLSPRLFGCRLFCAMRCALEVGAVTNKMVQIQALAALTLFTEGPDSPETASQLCAKMVRLVQTLGLHTRSEDKHREEHYEVTALCCAWAVDRLNAAIHGRPILMHERDIGRDIKKCIESQNPTFRLLLQIVSQLDRVIDLYRGKQGSKPTETEFNCPPFEDLVLSAQCANLHARLLNTLEMLYFAIVILSCRNVANPSKNRVRQLFAASRITALVRQEMGYDLLLIPFVPYAVSLSLSISYKQMRYTKLPKHRQRAQWELKSTCDLLGNHLSNHFYASSILAKIGKATLAEMDRVTLQHQQGSKNMNALVHRRSPAPPPATPASPFPSQLVQQLQQQQQQPPPYSYTDPLANADALDSDGDIENMDSDFSDDDDDEDELDDIVVAADVFEMFDPNFGLREIDACFQSNLDLCKQVYPSAYTRRYPI